MDEAIERKDEGPTVRAVGARADHPGGRARLRMALVALAALIGGTLALDATPAQAAQSGQPTLRLPWAVGEVGQMGSRTTPAHAHAGGSDRSSLDFIPSSGVVRAAGAGKVSLPCANMVRIDHGGGWHTGYYHLVDIKVKAGQTVKAGDPLGKISARYGCGGGASGAHVHFTLLKGSASNPKPANIYNLKLGDWTVQSKAPGCLVRGSTKACANARITFTAVPNAPGKPSCTPEGVGRLRFAWSAAASNGKAIAEYQVQYKRMATGNTASVSAGKNRSKLVTPRYAGENYQGRVRARNANGWGPYSAWSSSCKARKA